MALEQRLPRQQGLEPLHPDLVEDLEVQRNSQQLRNPRPHLVSVVLEGPRPLEVLGRLPREDLVLRQRQLVVLVSLPLRRAVLDNRPRRRLRGLVDLEAQVAPLSPLLRPALVAVSVLLQLLPLPDLEVRRLVGLARVLPPHNNPPR